MFHVQASILPAQHENAAFCQSLLLPAQICDYLFGSPLLVFYVVGMGAVLSAVPFLFVASPTPPPPQQFAEGEEGSLTLSKQAKVMGLL